ncbi:hypothetical protein [Dyadobacter sp. 676]|uniref:Uncharacterized protein n=1 Tax=Dyadobacter sp. 676 TaxID=3088362 RepID=A0AAU8FJC4_9BACT
MKKHILFFLLAGLAFPACQQSRGLAPAPETIFDDRGLHVITSFHNERSGTISVLYGNDGALANAGKEARAHMAGEVFKLVTWTLKGNPLWFGGNINGSLVSEETVAVQPGGQGVPGIAYTLEQHNGTAKNAPASEAERISFIFAQRASVFP